MKRIIAFGIIVFCIVAMFACSDKDEQGKNSGILADSDVIASIKQEIADKENSLLAAEGDVFWTPSGSLWHATYECGYLKNSRTIYHGTVEEAKREGKQSACERCSKSGVDGIYEQLDGNEIKSGDVFFTKDGEAWHCDINCEALIGAEKIYYGSEQTAKTLGKSDSCEKCKNNK